MVIDKFDGEYRFLSNFWLIDIEYLDETFRSVEHAYQSAKMVDPFDKYLIQSQRSPGAAKKLARTLPMWPNWEEIKDGIMLDLLRIKFRNPDLRDKLLATKDAELIEGNNWNDTYWGVCNGKGKNVLGNLLTLVRSEMRKD